VASITFPTPTTGTSHATTSPSEGFKTCQTTSLPYPRSKASDTAMLLRAVVRLDGGPLEVMLRLWAAGCCNGLINSLMSSFDSRTVQRGGFHASGSVRQSAFQFPLSNSRHALLVIETAKRPSESARNRFHT